MMCFNYFEDNGAFERTKEGKYKVNMDKAQEALKGWAAKILQVEGEGDYNEAKDYRAKNGVVRPSLQESLDKISEANIPVDIRYNQGMKALGLEK